jgi:hypothetical protein
MLPAIRPNSSITVQVRPTLSSAASRQRCRRSSAATHRWAARLSGELLAPEGDLSLATVILNAAIVAQEPMFAILFNYTPVFGTTLHGFQEEVPIL